MQPGAHHESLPGIGRGAEPIARLRHEELPRGADAPFPSDAARSLADGFSCREQIAQGTDRRGLHLAEVLRLAREAPDGRDARGAYPERCATRLPALPLAARLSRGLLSGLLVASLAVAVGVAARTAAR